LHQSTERPRLPVPLCPEAVAIGHQALAGKTRELLEPVKILEGRSEGAVASARQEAAHTDFLPGSIAQALALGTALEQRRGEHVLRLVFLDEAIDLGVR